MSIYKLSEHKFVKVYYIDINLYIKKILTIQIPEYHKMCEINFEIAQRKKSHFFIANYFIMS